MACWKSANQHTSAKVPHGTLATSEGRRTNADKRKAVETLLADSEWQAWSNVQVAKACGVSEALVRDVKGSIFEKNEDSPSATRTVQRNGTTYQQNTSNIGKKKPNIIERLQAQVNAAHGGGRGNLTPDNPVADPKAPKGVANKNGGTNGGKFYLSFLRNREAMRV